MDAHLAEVAYHIFKLLCLGGLVSASDAMTSCWAIAFVRSKRSLIIEAFLSATLMDFVSSFSFHSSPRVEPSGLVKCFLSLAGIRLR